MPGWRLPKVREPMDDADGSAVATSSASSASSPSSAPFNAFDRNPAPDYEISADELLRPFLEDGPSGFRVWRKQATNAPMAQVEDRYITGKLDLRGNDLNYLFRFENCRFEQPPDVREATLLGLVFRDCWLPGLKARNLRSRNDVRLIGCRVEVEEGREGSEDSMVRSVNAERGVPDAAVNLADAVVEGSVVLTRSELRYPHGKAIQADRLVITGALLGYRLIAEGEVRIPGLRAGGNVNFSGATLEKSGGFALNANGLRVGGSLLCEVDNYGPREKQRPFRTKGMVYMPGAQVSGDIVFRGAQLEMTQSGEVAVDAWKTGDWYVDPRPSLIADRLQVDGNVELSDGLDALGTLRMVNARLGGSLRLAKARVKVARGKHRPYRDRAVHLDGSEINGDLDGKELIVEGQLRLSDVSVRGNLLLFSSRFIHPERDAVSVRRSRISGNVWLSDCNVIGSVRLQGATVGGSIDLRGTELLRPETTKLNSWSADLRSVDVGRNIELSAHDDRAFRAEGGIALDGAVVKRRIDLTGAELNAKELNAKEEHGVALDAGDAAADEFVLAPTTPPNGRVVLRGAECGTLDDTSELWEATGGLDLEDFRYNALADPVELGDDAAVDERLRLLHRAMRGYRPGPYDQLAAMLRASGNEEHADTVLLKKQQYRYESLASGYRVLGSGVRLWSWLQRKMVGYGYRPVRALGWLMMLLVAGSLWFGLRSDDCTLDPDAVPEGQDRCAVNADDTGLDWNPVLYTVDLLVPIVDFGNKGRWHMDGADKWVATGFTAMGWVLATTVAAGVTRTLRRNQAS